MLSTSTQRRLGDLIDDVGRLLRIGVLEGDQDYMA